MRRGRDVGISRILGAVYSRVRIQPRDLTKRISLIKEGSFRELTVTISEPKHMQGLGNRTITGRGIKA